MLTIQAVLFVLQKQTKGNGSAIDISSPDFKIADSTLVMQTLELVHDLHQQSLLRSFVIGQVFAKLEGIKYNKELFTLATLLHDIGLEENNCCLYENIHCFAIEGAIAAGIFLKNQRLADERVKSIENAISLHLNLKVPKLFSEAYLLNKATATDTIVAYKKELGKTMISNIRAGYPILNFAEGVNDLLKKQCDIRSQSRIGFLYCLGFEKRLFKND